ncbi:MAG: response regulator transcription factor [Candidatus Symbiothrix sp.]|jgi:DNA-binding response OmpR family regulator|nr:response regulator transcription factor [Candidatus Symbiothrix sp.]
MNTTTTILIAENNQDFLYVVQWHFEQKGFRVFSSVSGKNTLELFGQNNPDIILLDISLDDEIDGKEVARKIRAVNKYIPIIFMSGENKSPADVVEGFEIGCTYFLKKPVTIEEIETHVHAALKMKPSIPIYKFDKCSFIFENRMIVFENKKEYLSDKEAAVLRILSDHLSEIVPLSDILQNVWQDVFMEESLRNVISSLRKKLVGKGLTIKTIKNKGYQLNS